ncbi:MAG TPA: hypothetical protein PLM33_00445 [Acidobacteriota bacterium]|nr:hypothetical protein [Acidobacteriota bacterium]HRR26847.1 hypothetical protein [Acidobacteriota bacterium]HRR57527.1 hypothetical protein [Acidobacteriota bacterium]HRV07204.1 hypothetical protein [Acidobacteriota bacterium]
MNLSRGDWELRDLRLPEHVAFVALLGNPFFQPSRRVPPLI